MEAMKNVRMSKLFAPERGPRMGSEERKALYSKHMMIQNEQQRLKNNLSQLNKEFGVKIRMTNWEIRQMQQKNKDHTKLPKHTLHRLQQDYSFLRQQFDDIGVVLKNQRTPQPIELVAQAIVPIRRPVTRAKSARFLRKDEDIIGLRPLHLERPQTAPVTLARLDELSSPYRCPTAASNMGQKTLTISRDMTFRRVLSFRELSKLDLADYDDLIGRLRQTAYEQKVDTAVPIRSARRRAAEMPVPLEPRLV